MKVIEREGEREMTKERYNKREGERMTVCVREREKKLKQGTLTEGECSVQLTSSLR